MEFIPLLKSFHSLKIKTIDEISFISPEVGNIESFVPFVHELMSRMIEKRHSTSESFRSVVTGKNSIVTYKQKFNDLDIVPESVCVFFLRKGTIIIMDDMIHHIKDLSLKNLPLKGHTLRIEDVEKIIVEKVGKAGKMGKVNPIWFKDCNGKLIPAWSVSHEINENPYVSIVSDQNGSILRTSENFRT